MADLNDVVARWQRGWGVARELPAATPVDGGVRVRCLQMGRAVEYFALDPAAIPSLAAQVLAEEEVTWLSVATDDPGRDSAALQAAGLILLRDSERMMSIDLRTHPRHSPAAPYELTTTVTGGVVKVEVHDESGDLGARGYLGVAGDSATVDKILTYDAHRRRGLASAVMSALATAALAEGAGRGLLIASEEGQYLYKHLGWTTVAGVLISARPGTVYPT